MAYYAVDKDGYGYIYSDIPVRDNKKGSWLLPEKGRIVEGLNGNKLFNINIDWNDSPIEIIAADKNSTYVKIENIGEGSELDIICGIKDLLTKKVREGLVKLMGKEDIKLMPPISNGKFVMDIPCLSCKFYFKAIIYKDESFNFLGYKGDNLNVPFILSEHDLPDGGLLAILEFLSIGKN